MRYYPKPPDRASLGQLVNVFAGAAAGFDGLWLGGLQITLAPKRREQ